MSTTLILKGVRIKSVPGSFCYVMPQRYRHRPCGVGNHFCRIRAAIIDMPRRMRMESRGYIQDCSLVREAQRGNQAAFEQLVRSYDQAVLRLAARLTGSESEAQDVHQEAFLRVYKKLDGFRFECSFGTWIYRIVTNVCLDHLRRKQARKNIHATGITDDNLLNQLTDD